MEDVLARSGVELARNLRRLCDNETKRYGVVEDNGHLALIALLYAGADSKTTEHALRALLKLSFDVAASSATLVQADVADPTVALLRTAPTPSNETVMKNAAIPRLVMNRMNRRELMRADSLMPMS